MDGWLVGLFPKADDPYLIVIITHEIASPLS